MTVDGALYQHLMSVRTIRESAGGASAFLGTPRASMGKKGICQKRALSGEHRYNLEDQVAHQEYLKAGIIQKAPTPSGMWLTPVASDRFTGNLKSSQQKQGSMHSVGLSAAVQMYPTPMAQDTIQRNNPEYIQRRREKGLPITLQMYVAEKEMLPTPVAADSQRRNTSLKANENRLKKGHQITLAMEIGGKLAPKFVEWLMGWPINYTKKKLTPDYSDLAMDKYPSSVQSHGKSLQEIWGFKK